MPPGGPNAKFERLTTLLYTLLTTPRPLTQEELTREIEGYPTEPSARRGAFERDKRVLREQGVPIIIETVVRGEHEVDGYRVDAAAYQLPTLDLTADEQVALRLAIAAVRLDVPTAGDPSASLGLVDVDAPPPLATLPAADGLPALFEAVQGRQRVRFDYRGKARVLDPYVCVSRFGFWYAVGLDRDAGEARTYRVDRIEGPVTPTGDTFDRPRDFDVDAVLARDPKLIGEGERTEALVLVDGPHAARVVAGVGADRVRERREDGSVVVAVDVVNRHAFRSWLLGLLDHAEVLAPDDLRAEMRDWLASVAGVRA